MPRLTVHNKLVRDNIPTIIEESGKTCQTRIASEDEMFHLLIGKLQEEVQEFVETPCYEELGDILDVVMALVRHKEFGEDVFNKTHSTKLNFNGGFKKGIILETVLEK